MNPQAQLLQKAGKLELACDFAALANIYRQMLAAEPGNTGIMVELGRTVLRLGQTEAAAECFNAAITRDPACFAAWCNLGTLQLDADEHAQAIASFENAGRVDRRSALPPLNLGLVHHRKGDLDAALIAYRRATALAPNMPEAHFHLANGLSDAQRHADAIAAYERALKLRPRYAEARWNMAHSLLMQGEHERGWAAFEARWQTGHLNHEARAFAQAQWHGEAIAGKTLLLWSEQGFGDTLQFCRYAPLAAARGARVIVGTRPQLRDLLGSLADVAEVVDLEGALPAFERHCPLMSLPRVFGTTAASIPAHLPYLTAPPLLASSFAARFKPSGRLRVGLVWSAGLRRHDASLFLAGAGKSMPASLLGTLRNPAIEFFKLQVDAPDVSLPLAMTDCSADLKTFADTAALMDSLDLVISVDTAAAHLAGALGLPVWLLLSDNACWRWGLAIATCPWYPGMRIFRQATAGDWRAPLDQVRLALAEIVDAQPGKGTAARAGIFASLFRRSRG